MEADALLMSCGPEPVQLIALEFQPLGELLDGLGPWCPPGSTLQVPDLAGAHAGTLSETLLRQSGPEPQRSQHVAKRWMVLVRHGIPAPSVSRRPCYPYSVATIPAWHLSMV